MSRPIRRFLTIASAALPLLCAAAPAQSLSLTLPELGVDRQTNPSGPWTLYERGLNGVQVPIGTIDPIGGIFTLGVLPSLNLSYRGNGLAFHVTTKATGPGNAAGGTGAAISYSSDDIAAQANGGSYYQGFMVNDQNFGGPNATGGRILIGSNLIQTRPTGAASSSNTLHDFISNQSLVASNSGDGGTSATARGTYYGGWDVAYFGPNAKHMDSVQGREIDMDMNAGSSAKHKTGLLIGGSVDNGSPDAVQGSVNDSLLWLTACGTQCVGARMGIQFGRSDIPATFGVSAKGSLIGTIGNTLPVANGINFASTHFTKYAWLTYGSSIDGNGNALFNSVTSNAAFSISPAGTQVAALNYGSRTLFLDNNGGGSLAFRSGASLPIVASIGANGVYQETLFTPASSSAACNPGQFADDANYHYVCTAPNTWKRAALSAF